MRNVVLFISIVVFSHLPARGSVIDSLLQVLDSAMEANESYMLQKERRIESLMHLMEKPGISKEETYAIHTLLYEEYVKFNFDSTLLYINRNLKIAEELGRIAWQVETRFLASCGGYPRTGYRTDH